MFLYSTSRDLGLKSFSLVSTQITWHSDFIQRALESDVLEKYEYIGQMVPSANGAHPCVYQVPNRSFSKKKSCSHPSMITYVEFNLRAIDELYINNLQFEVVLYSMLS